MKSTIYFSALLLIIFLYGCFPDSGKVAQQEEIADTASLKIDSSLVIDAKIFQEKEFLDTVIGTWKLLGTYNPWAGNYDEQTGKMPVFIQFNRDSSFLEYKGDQLVIRDKFRLKESGSFYGNGFFLRFDKEYAYLLHKHGSDTLTLTVGIDAEVRIFVRSDTFALQKAINEAPSLRRKIKAEEKNYQSEPLDCNYSQLISTVHEKIWDSKTFWEFSKLHNNDAAFAGICFKIYDKPILASPDIFLDDYASEKYNDQISDFSGEEHDSLLLNDVMYLRDLSEKMNEEESRQKILNEISKSHEEGKSGEIRWMIGFSGIYDEYIFCKVQFTYDSSSFSDHNIFRFGPVLCCLFKFDERREIVADFYQITHVD